MKSGVDKTKASFFMGGYLVLLRPYFIEFRSIITKPGRGGRAKTMLVGLFGFVLWCLIFFFTVRVLRNMLEAEFIGQLLARRFMTLLWIAAGSLLAFSSLIASLSSFFLAKDLDTLMAAPVSLESIFWARSTRTLISAAWMPAGFLLPVLAAYGYVFKASLLYYLITPLAALPLLAGAAYISQGLSFFLVILFPARRAREIMALLAVCVFSLLYLAFRLMRPEDLLAPDNFASASAYLASLSSASFFNPAEWATFALWPHLDGRPGPIPTSVWLALLWLSAAALAVIVSHIAAFLYWPAYNKSLEGAGRRKAAGTLMRFIAAALGFFMKPQRRAIAVKDFKTFFRDQTQWSQLLLLAALLAVYLYNFSLLNLRLAPLGSGFLENAFSFLNLGLVALVAATLCLRFAFTSISGEGFAWWIIKSAPMPLSDFMWIKFWCWLPPIWLLSVLLVFLGNYYLGADISIQVAAALVIAALTPGLCGLAVGLGARYPSFATENLAQAPTGYGGLVYMVASSLASIAVIALTAWPMLLARGAGRGHTPSLKMILLAALFCALALGLCRQLLAVPMRRGLRYLAEDDV